MTSRQELALSARSLLSDLENAQKQTNARVSASSNEAMTNELSTRQNLYMSFKPRIEQLLEAVKQELGSDFALPERQESDESEVIDDAMITLQTDHLGPSPFGKLACLVGYVANELDGQGGASPGMSPWSMSPQG